MKLYLAEFHVQRTEYMGVGEENQNDAARKHLRIVTANNEKEAKQAIYHRFHRDNPCGESFHVIYVDVHEAISLDVKEPE